MPYKYLLITVLSLSFIYSHTLLAKTFSYNDINKMPKSVEKDYYIWRFLSQKSTTVQEAQAVISQSSQLNKKLRSSYKSKTGKNARLRTIKVSTKEVNNWKKRSKANKSFKKGLWLMQQNKPVLASQYFDLSRKNYKKIHDIDKTLFWLYLSTKDKNYLNHLRRSSSVNIYTMVAADIVNAKYPKTITQKFKKSKTHNFDIKDPISWAKIKHKMKKSKDINNLAKKYASQECIGIYTYLKSKMPKSDDNYFPMPYRKIMKNINIKRQALIYAIARQESRFVPASVSRSFALGMMQFMPFLVKHVAKEKNQTIDLDDMFNPHKAIEYADHHLDYLNSYLYHPLFVAYAYNAGIGFTKRHIQNSKNFRRGKYEPYMSIEKMKNYEAREYGKKVLANYVVYLNKLGVSTRIFPLLELLHIPSKTDKFRK